MLLRVKIKQISGEEYSILNYDEDVAYKCSKCHKTIKDRHKIYYGNKNNTICNNCFSEVVADAMYKLQHIVDILKLDTIQTEKTMFGLKYIINEHTKPIYIRCDRCNKDDFCKTTLKCKDTNEIICYNCYNKIMHLYKNKKRRGPRAKIIYKKVPIIQNGKKCPVCKSRMGHEFVKYDNMGKIIDLPIRFCRLCELGFTTEEDIQDAQMIYPNIKIKSFKIHRGSKNYILNKILDVKKH